MTDITDEPKFLIKFREMINEILDKHNICEWDEGKIIIKDLNRFKEIHKKFFTRQSNLKSLIRQLNFYGFKIVRDNNNMTITNENFLRNEKIKILRKKRKNCESRKRKVEIINKLTEENKKLKLEVQMLNFLLNDKNPKSGLGTPSLPDFKYEIVHNEESNQSEAKIFKPLSASISLQKEGLLCE